jgi:hypothetical protein
MKDAYEDTSDRVGKRVRFKTGKDVWIIVYHGMLGGGLQLATNKKIRTVFNRFEDLVEVR